MALTVLPRRIRLEASSICQLRCPACPNFQGRIPNRGFLRLEDFRSLMEKNPFVREVEISNWGEVFLNPDLVGIMACAFESGIHLYCENGTNLNTVSERAMEGLVKYRFRSLFCSIDGASQETYAQYRVGGDFGLVIRNIQGINFFKKKYGSPFPMLTWQFIVFPHNMHEVPLARAMASRLGMGFYTKRAKGGGRSSAAGVSGHLASGKATGAFGRNPNLHMCAELWTGPQIDHDGEMLGCCKIKESWGAGNVFATGLLAVVNGEKMRQARAMVIGRGEERDDIPCSRCHRFRWMKSHGRWLSPSRVSATRLMMRARRFLPAGTGYYTMLNSAALRFLD